VGVHVGLSFFIFPPHALFSPSPVILFFLLSVFFPSQRFFHCRDGFLMRLPMYILRCFSGCFAASGFGVYIASIFVPWTVWLIWKCGSVVMMTE